MKDRWNQMSQFRMNWKRGCSWQLSKLSCPTWSKEDSCGLKMIQIQSLQSGMFMAALFIISKICKQSKCPSTGEWINKKWHIHIMASSSTIVHSFSKRVNYGHTHTQQHEQISKNVMLREKARQENSIYSWFLFHEDLEQANLVYGDRIRNRLLRWGRDWLGGAWGKFLGW